jgi:hypothetical protein
LFIKTQAFYTEPTLYNKRILGYFSIKTTSLVVL